jgi:hypothetical protein
MRINATLARISYAFVQPSMHFTALHLHHYLILDLAVHACIIFEEPTSSIPM